MIEILKALFLGIVEGITEWLPISSTGHLILANEFIKLNASDAFLEMFEVVIQLGAIFAVVVLFWNKLWPFCIRKKERSFIDRYCKRDVWQMWFKVLVACVPAFFVLPFDDELNALFYNWQTVVVMLILVGVLFIVVETLHQGKPAKVNSIAEMSYLTALLIGVCQVVAAVFPGTSRSGATIIGALVLGVSRTVAAEFTFYLAIPAMFGASLLKLLKFGFSFTSLEAVTLLVGMVSAFLVSLVAIKFLMGYIKKHNFKVFGWYRIALGIVVTLYFLIFA